MLRGLHRGLSPFTINKTVLNDMYSAEGLPIIVSPRDQESPLRFLGRKLIKLRLLRDTDTGVCPRG